MHVVTWDPIETQAPRPRTQRLSYGALRPGMGPEAFAQLVDEDIEALIMPHPWREPHTDPDARRRAGEWAAAWPAALAARCPRLRAVFVDHPPPSWRSFSGGDRRSAIAQDEFMDVLLGPMHDAGMDAVQYGVFGHDPRRPRSPVVWSGDGLLRMLESARPIGSPMMPWIRGVGGWAPNGEVPTQRVFLHYLLSAWMAGASWACVWFDGRVATDDERRQMADVIDLVTGVAWRLEDGAPATGDFAGLLSVLSGGVHADQFAQMLTVLASWQSNRLRDPDLPATEEGGEA